MKYTAEIDLILNHKDFSISRNAMLKLNWDELNAYFLTYKLEMLSDVFEAQMNLPTIRTIKLKSIEGFEVYHAIKLGKKHPIHCGILKDVNGSRNVIFSDVCKLYRL